MKMKLKTRRPAICAISLSLLAGCQSNSTTKNPKLVGGDITFQRGAQLLAAGSPKSAIPFLTLTIASQPDGPEPLALLALAYSLDLQDQRAILEAGLVHRPSGMAPGWEFVAVSIAEMKQNRPHTATVSLQHGIASLGEKNPIEPSARQWLVLAQLLDGKHGDALQSLAPLCASSKMRTSTMLWAALIQSYHGRTHLAPAALEDCAQSVVSDSGQSALQRSLVGADDQILYDAGVAAIAVGNFDTAEKLFTQLQEHNPNSSDAGIWLAMIPGARGDWQSTRTQLKDACEKGSPTSRGLANQLFSVICALEDRPDAMIEHLLAGQRSLGRSQLPVHPIDEPTSDKVWVSDAMH
jgi:tetratricopeptide (TPR) repeat protein